MYCIKYIFFYAIQIIYCIKILHPLEVLFSRADLEVALGDAEVEFGIADEGELRTKVNCSANKQKIEVHFMSLL